MEHYIDEIVGEYSDAHEADLTKAITNIPASQPPTMTSEDTDIPREVLKAINHQINYLKEEYTFWSRGRNSALWIYDEET